MVLPMRSVSSSSEAERSRVGVLPLKAMGGGCSRAYTRWGGSARGRAQGEGCVSAHACRGGRERGGKRAARKERDKKNGERPTAGPNAADRHAPGQFGSDGFTLHKKNAFEKTKTGYC